MATVSQTTPYSCGSIVFFGDEAIKRAINARDGYIKRFYHAKGEHVRKIQRVIALFYELDIGTSSARAIEIVNLDAPGKGVFGKQTESAVMNYQLSFQLYGANGAVDGICGPQTLRHMDAYWRENRPFHLGFDPITRQAY